MRLTWFPRFSFFLPWQLPSSENFPFTNGFLVSQKSRQITFCFQYLLQLFIYLLWFFEKAWCLPGVFFFPSTKNESFFTKGANLCFRRDCASISVLFTSSGNARIDSFLGDTKSFVTNDFLEFVRSLGWPVSLLFALLPFLFPQLLQLTSILSRLTLKSTGVLKVIWIQNSPKPPPIMQTFPWKQYFMSHASSNRNSLPLFRPLTLSLNLTKFLRQDL